MFEFIHFLHVACAVVYGGSSIAYSFIITPALIEAHSDERKRLNVIVQKYGDRLIIPSALLLIASGIAQVWTRVMITSFGDILNGYGLVASLSLLTLIIWQVYETPIRRRLSVHIENDDLSALKRDANHVKWTKVVMLSVMLCFMMALKMGYY